MPHHVDKQANSDLSIIPGGLTGLSSQQNKPFKAFYKDLYAEWTVSEQHTYTAAGNVRAPTKLLSAIKARLTLIFDHFYMQVLVLITGQKKHWRTFV